MWSTKKWINLDLLWSQFERVLGPGTEHWRFWTESSPLLDSTKRITHQKSLSETLKWLVDGNEVQSGLKSNTGVKREEREREVMIRALGADSAESSHDALMMGT